MANKSLRPSRFERQTMPVPRGVEDELTRFERQERENLRQRCVRLMESEPRESGTWKTLAALVGGAGAMFLAMRFWGTRRIRVSEIAGEPSDPPIDPIVQAWHNL